MRDGPNIARIATLVGDPARAEILTELMHGEALTATELVGIAGLTKQTVSAHLAKLVDARLLAVEHQGRHRYFRLADPDVAELLERLMGVAYRTGAVRVRSSPREPALRKARVCYDHLAGELGVLVLDGLIAKRLLRTTESGPALTRRGKAFCIDFGIPVDALAATRRPLCRTCLDWSARRLHLAGALGAALLASYRCAQLERRRREGTTVAPAAA
jgi:DNA-binding transcriptional ArsR family regulator